MREAILLIPGVNGKVQNRQRDRLVEGLITVPRHVTVKELPPPPGADARRLEVTCHDGDPRTIDVHEAYWGDIMTSLSASSLGRRVRNGFPLLLYWIPLAFGRSFVSGGYMGWTLGVAAAALFFWYLGVLALVLDQAIDQLLTHFPNVATPTRAAAVVPWIERAASRLDGVVSAMVLIAGATVVFAPVGQLVDIAAFTRRYLRGMCGPKDDVAIVDRVGCRVRDAFDTVCAHQHYDRVTIVAHSFGATIAAEVLSRVPLGDRAGSFRLVTLGGSLAVTALQAPWVADRIATTESRRGIREWIDLYADTDWLCTATPPQAITSRIVSRKIEHAASWLDVCLGRTHDRYYSHPEAIAVLVDAPGDRTVTPVPEPPVEHEDR